MNLIVGSLILLCLFGSEFLGSQVADDVGARLWAVLAVVLVVPGLAFFQTHILLRKMRNEDLDQRGKQSLCRRMTATHAIAWLSASVAIIWAIRWQDVVRGNWSLDRWPLVDELMILAPIVFSMVASWAIFYELQVAIQDDDKADKDTTNDNLAGKWRHWFAKMRRQFQPRLGFISIRFRLYFLLILIPVSVFVSIRDCAGIISSLPEPAAMYLCIIGLAIMIVVFPLLTLLIWKTAKIEDIDLQRDLSEICDEQHLNVMAIRVWKTGDQIVNAAVAGVFPWLRVILLSDGLMNLFQRKEIEAVVRHEAGHIRLWHLPTRLVFLILPLVALAICDSGSNGITPSQLLSGPIWVAAIPILAFAAYFLLTTRWLSHQMEHEADMYSIQGPGSNVDVSPKLASICPDRADGMRDALLRLAAICPELYERNSFLHPSIRCRIEFIDRILEFPESGNQFRKSFARRRLVMALLLIVASVSLIVLV